jgi:hypothetical protein
MRPEKATLSGLLYCHYNLRFSIVSPLQGFLISYAYPGLTPGAVFLRPFGAGRRVLRQKLAREAMRR